jgi:hypothetical protein
MTMATPKPRPTPPPEDSWGLPSDEEPVEFDDRRLEELLTKPGVVVHRRDPKLAVRSFPPVKTTGTMSMAELRWMLGRIDDDELTAELDAERQSKIDRSP